MGVVFSLTWLPRAGHALSTRRRKATEQSRQEAHYLGTKPPAPANWLAPTSYPPIMAAGGAGAVAGLGQAVVTEAGGGGVRRRGRPPSRRRHGKAGAGRGARGGGGGWRPGRPGAVLPGATDAPGPGSRAPACCACCACPAPGPPRDPVGRFPRLSTAVQSRPGPGLRTFRVHTRPGFVVVGVPSRHPASGDCRCPTLSIADPAAWASRERPGSIMQQGAGRQGGAVREVQARRGQ